MRPFTSLTAIAAPLPLEDVDTDKIIPARYLKTIQRTGLGRHLFAGLRYAADGSEIPAFVLNQAPFRQAEILIALDNFGCGSSREHAAWALLDFGVRCVIAPSFADIFYSNALKNGVLPVILPRPICEALMADAALGANARLTVDLERLLVLRPSGEAVSFSLDPLARRKLLLGLDEIGETLERAAAIAAFETARRDLAFVEDIRL